MEQLLSSLTHLSPDELEKQYNAMRSQTSQWKRDQGLTTDAGAQRENIKKNRYKDILPYDQTRVVLTLLTSESDSDYINASFIQGATADKRYIASQAPLSSTVTDFWRMIWQHDVKVIVMACRVIEMGKRKSECYWTEIHQPTAFGPFTVNNQGETCPREDTLVRALTVTYQQVTRSLTQHHFLSWPDHDVPLEASGVLDLLQRVRECQGTHTSPLLLHCSAGCGRTGVICALDYISDLLVTKSSADFSIMEIVLQLRRQRPSAVQTKDQYQFIFSAVVCLIKRLLQTNGRQIYSNLPQQANTREKKATVTPAARNTRLLRLSMNDTYAVVNKPKHAPPPLTSPTHSPVALPTSSRTLPASHHYDNDPAGTSAAPIYSCVRPRGKQLSLPPSATPIYDTGAAAASLHSNTEYQLVKAGEVLQTNDDYEEFSSASSLCPAGGIGFNCRIQKPRGPRDPPAQWSRLER